MMLRFLKELCSDYQAAHREMAEMGIWILPTMTGLFAYVDEEQFKNYQKKKENNEHT